MSDKTYEDGLRDGKLQAIEEMIQNHAELIEAHETRLTNLERALWALGGIASALAMDAIPLLQILIG